MRKRYLCSLRLGSAWCRLGNLFTKPADHADLQVTPATGTCRTGARGTALPPTAGTGAPRLRGVRRGPAVAPRRAGENTPAPKRALCRRCARHVRNSAAAVPVPELPLGAGKRDASAGTPRGAGGHHRRAARLRCRPRGHRPPPGRAFPPGRSAPGTLPPGGGTPGCRSSPPATGGASTGDEDAHPAGPAAYGRRTSAGPSGGAGHRRCRTE